MNLGAVVVCGGESRRMGRPKAWLPFGSEFLLQRIVGRVGEVADSIVVVGAEGQELPPLSSRVAIVRDAVSGRGPLQGLAAGLRALPEEVELAYATATDVPFLAPGWIRRLVELLGEADLAIPRVDGYHHPLAAVYRRGSVVVEAERLLAGGRLRPVFLMEELRAREVDADELREVDPGFDTLRNLNTPADYEAALARAGLGARPRVVVELHGVPRLRAGRSRVEVEGATVGEVLAALATECPGLGGDVVRGGRLDPAYILNRDGAEFVSDPEAPMRDGECLILLAIDVGG
jgi:molybdopterin-guanine dinucleotide biosynthesis protein A